MTRNIVTPQANIYGRNSLSPPPPQALIFSDPPFSKIEIESCPPPISAERVHWYCDGITDYYQNIRSNSYFIFICIQMNIKTCTLCISLSKRVSSYIVFKVIFFFTLVFISFRNSSIFLQLFLNSHGMIIPQNIT